MPGAGHIVHMPAHIYQRVGRHADVDQGEPAGGEGRRGLHRAVPRAGAVSAGVLPAQPALHLDGRDGERAAARSRSSRRSKLAGSVPQEALGTVPILQGFLVVPVLGDGALRPVGRDPRGPGPAHDDAVHARACGATRARWRLIAKGQARRARAGARAAARDRRRPGAQGADDVLVEQRLRACCALRRKSWPARSRREAQGLGHGDCCISNARCATRTRSSIRNRPTGTRRCGRRWAPCCSKPAAPTKPRPCSGRT